MSQETSDSEVWAIVELMGHRKLAGIVTQSTSFGVPLLRIDVPAVVGIPAYTQMYGNSAIYCVSIVDEDTARAAALAFRQSPLTTFRGEVIPISEHLMALDQMRAMYKSLTQGDEVDQEYDFR